MMKRYCSVLPLTDVTRVDTARVGRKAAVLGELLRASFPVPDGFVITAEALEQVLAENGPSSHRTPEQIATIPLPDALVQELRTITEVMRDTALAVRSSGLSEDLPGLSYAGQYESILNVTGLHALEQAVRDCWASAFSRRVSSYQVAHQVSSSRQIAILVQRMVPAEAAGVAFSANPVTGKQTEAVVSAVRGLGDRLVSGVASPDEWIVSGADAVSQTCPEHALTAKQALTVAELVRRVERHFGMPQDIEWALADGQFWLLQARPITALPEPASVAIPVPVEVPPGFWQRDTFSLRPLSPMQRSLVLPVRRAGIKYIFAYSLVEGPEYREIGGWMYSHFVTMGPDREPPSWMKPLISRLIPALTPLAIRLIPKMRDRVQHIATAVRTDEPDQLIHRWYEHWQPEQATRMTALRESDLTTLDDKELDDHLRKVTVLAEEAMDIHFRTAGPVIILVGELGVICRNLFGWDASQTLTLLTGLEGKTTEPAIRLSELAQMVKQRPLVQSLLQQIDANIVESLSNVDDEFERAFVAYLREFGCRSLSNDLTEAAIAEQPALVLRLIRDQITRAFDPVAKASELKSVRASAEDRARAAIATQPVAVRERFERTLTRARQAYPVGDDSAFFTSVAWTLVRYALLELGHRLAARGQIAQQHDVFFLGCEEARATFHRGDDRRSLVSRRKGERAWIEAHPGPATYGRDPGPPPPLDSLLHSLSPEVREIVEASLWSIGAASGDRDQNRGKGATDSYLSGLAASAGRYTGPVCVVRNEAEFGKLHAGDVLVCPITTAQWSMLFPSVGALVTDMGGLLSHPAIIAREYHIPAIVATGNATQFLHDGQMVTIDGSTGQVELSRIPEAQ